MEQKEIQGYPNYIAYSDGRIFSKNNNAFKKWHINDNGYCALMLNRENKKKNFKVHRLIALTFIPNPENKPQVNHINGIKTDNRVENLEWCNASENALHAYKKGLSKISKLNIDISTKRMKARTGANHTGSRKIIDVKTKVVYVSIRDAALKSGLNVSTLWCYLNNTIPNKTALRYFDEEIF